MKTMLNKILRGTITALSLLPLLFSCDEEIENNYLLFCTFEGDPIGSGPNKALPGAPLGDELIYQADDGIIVLNAHGQKSMALPYSDEQAGGPNIPGQIRFVAKPLTSKGNDAITFTWSGQLFGYYRSGSFWGGHSYVSIVDDQGTIMCSMQICVDGSLMVYKHKSAPPAIEIYELWPFVFPIGANLSQHTFTLTFDLQQQQFKLKLDVNGQTVITKYGIPFYGVEVPPKRDQRFTLHITAYDDGGYILDNVTIQKTPSIGPVPPIEF